MGNDQQSNHHRRSSSTHSLPALGRRLSSGSLKAVKWIGKQLKSKKSSSISDSEELWGTSRELPAEAADHDEPPVTPSCRPSRPNQQQASVPQSTLEHRVRRRALENHWDDIYSFDSHHAPMIPKPTSLQRRAPPPRPLTSQVRGRARLQSLSSNPPPTPPHHPSHVYLDNLPPTSPYHTVRLQSLERHQWISALPTPGPPPSRPLPQPPKPTSLYPIPPPTLPLRIPQRNKIYDEESVYEKKVKLAENYQHQLFSR
ncbi:uncharacterized protein VP01_637g9 [Puccinia sorghi]|uniref:Uncharacterized protein n=1 Tax=Puccinia sorghi TaxID=27349 RepID=A0A0L6UG09_9BASI|nr:uncharacterized protein VP01_637g9 [Puccinia sorghi]